MREFEKKETMERIDAPSPQQVMQAARAMRERGGGMSERVRLLVDWVLPAALGLLAALFIGLILWLLVIV